MTISQRILTDFEAEAASTRKLLAVVPDDKFDWKPHDKSWSLGQLAGHIAENPTWLGSMLEDEMDFAEMPADYQPFVPANAEELMAAFEKNLEQVGPSLSDKDDAFMESTWTMRKGDTVIATEPKHQAIRSILLRHLVHHRGQLTVYLRLLDVALPQVYGPTADAPEF